MTMTMESALNIPEVLEAVMGKLDRKSLLDCRLINRTWNKEASTILQRQVVIQLRNPSDLDRFTKTCDSSIKEISFAFQVLEIYSHRRSSCRSPSAPIGMEVIHNFVKTFPTQQVKSLSLHFLSSVLVSPTKIHFIIHNYFPNLAAVDIEINAKFVNTTPEFLQARKVFSNTCKLKTVGISLSNTDFVSVDKLTVINWFIKTLLAGAPNLESVKLKAIESSEYKEDIISSIISPHLREIRLHDAWVSSENLNALSTHVFNFTLTTVHLLDIDLRKVDMTHFKTFLSRYSSSIEELKLDFSKKYVPERFDFPLDVYMKNLRILLLNGLGKGAWIDWSKLPQLTQLKLYNSCIEQISASIMAYPNHCFLKIVDILSSVNSMERPPKPLFRQLAPYLHSQLTELHLVSLWDVSSVLAVIFKECAHLKYFECWDNDDTDLVTDQVICGVGDLPMMTVTWPDEENVKEEIIEDGYRLLVAQASRRPCAQHAPYIGDLKELQILILHGNFSEVALLHGIIHCASIRKLDLNSDAMDVKRSTCIIHQAHLVHLTGAKINENFINNLPAT